MIVYGIQKQFVRTVLTYSFCLNSFGSGVSRNRTIVGLKGLFDAPVASIVYSRNRTIMGLKFRVCSVCSVCLDCFCSKKAIKNPPPQGGEGTGREEGEE